MLQHGRINNMKYGSSERTRHLVSNWLLPVNQNMTDNDRFGEKMKKVWNGPAGIYLLKVNDRNSRKKFKICSKLTINTPLASFWCLYC